MKVVKGKSLSLAHMANSYMFKIRQSIQATFDTPAFRDQFSQLNLSERVVSLIEYHISYVHEAMDVWNGQ